MRFSDSYDLPKSVRINFIGQREALSAKTHDNFLGLWIVLRIVRLQRTGMIERKF